MRGFVTSAIERSIASATASTTSSRRACTGSRSSRARLKLNYDATKALADITAKVNQVRNELPPEAECPRSACSRPTPSLRPRTSASPRRRSRRARSPTTSCASVQPRLAALQGVQRADIFGARTFAMRVWLQPDRMAALNVSPAQVRAALAANNYLAAVGSTKGALVQVNLTANTDLHTVEEFKQLVIRQQNDTIVRLQDVADVELGAEDYDTEVRFNGQTAVFMGIFPLPNANTIDVVKRVRAELEEIKQRPAGRHSKPRSPTTPPNTSATRSTRS